MSERTGAAAQQRGGWKQWTPAQALRELKSWRRSGMPLERYARQRGIGAQRLRWWRDRLEAPSGRAADHCASTPNLVPAIVTAPLLSVGGAQVALRMEGGLTVEIADVHTVPAEWVGELIAAIVRAKQ